MENYYEQNRNVIRLHNFPRFGHTNQLSSLADEDEKNEYFDGILAFVILTLCIFAVWAWSLLMLKCFGGLDRVGCAAGGEPIDVVALRDRGVRRWQRRRRIVRSWRLQIVFAFASFLLITFSFVFANNGLTPFAESLVDFTTTMSVVRTRVLNGMHLTHLLSSQMTLLRPYVDLDIKTLCPNYAATRLETDYSFQITSEEIKNALQKVDLFIETDVNTFLRGIDQVAETCTAVESAMTATEENDWLVRLLLTTINVSNIFLFFGVVLTRNKINSSFYQSVLGALFIPILSICIPLVVTVLCLISAVAMINADFCSGGAHPGGPVGTLIDFVIRSGYEREYFMIRVFDYFTVAHCQDANPLIFLHDLESTLLETSGRVTEMSQHFQVLDNELLSLECGADFSVVNTTFSQLGPILTDVARSVTRVKDLTSCEQVSPVLNDLARGPVCHEMADALSWMYFTWLVIVLTMMILLSTRAALFNPLLPAPKKKRREKEFRQYKRFMEEYGFDTSDWQLDPPKKPSVSELRTDTFDTEETDSVILATPEARDEQSEASFPGEPPTEDDIDDNSEAKEGLEPLPEVDEDLDNGSAYSADSDDSSLNPPPSVMSQMAFSLSSSVSSAMKRLVRARTNSSISMSYDSQGHEIHGRRQSYTPTKYRQQKNILGPMDESHDDWDTTIDEERVPLSPPLQPVAPQKSRKHLRRTRGCTNLE